MSQITIVDIGTHKAEELKVLASYHPYILNSYCKWILDFALRSFRSFLPPFKFRPYGIGPYLYSPFHFAGNFHLKCILNRVCSNKDFLVGSRVICIDPQAAITSKELNAISHFPELTYLPIALFNHTSADEYALRAFNICFDTLSSSLDSEPSKIRSHTICACLSTPFLLEQLLKLEHISDESTFILRLNCEGAELAVLQAFIDKGLKPSAVIGSINDVFKKYGRDDANSLQHLLSDNDIPFYYFKGSDPSTWQATIKFITNLFSHR